jgi:hypothetical protein
MVTMRMQSDPRILDLALIENLQPGLTERALIDNALQFANSGELSAFKSASGIIEMMELPAPFYREERAALRAALTDIIKARDDKKGAPAGAVEWRRRRNRVLLASDEGGGQHLIVLDSLPRAAGGRVGLAHYAPTAQFAYVLLLFLDEEKPYGLDLCQCNLKDCGKFFFAKLPRKGTGRMQRQYCPESNHREMAHRATAPERVRKSRRNRKRKSKGRSRGNR